MSTEAMKQAPVAWKLVPRNPTEKMLKEMDECSTEGYDERLYAGHAASVYMAAVDAAPCQPTPRIGNCLLTGVCVAEGHKIQKAEKQEPVDKKGSPCPEFWEWLPKAYNFNGDGNFTKYNMEIAFLAGKQSVASNDTSQERVDEIAKQRHEQEPVAWVDKSIMELAESVGLIGPASRTDDLHGAIQRFHDLICANATIKAALMAADVIQQASPPQRQPLTADDLQEPKNGTQWRVEWWNESCRMMLPSDSKLDGFTSYKNGTMQFTIKKAAHGIKGEA